MASVHNRKLIAALSELKEKDAEIQELDPVTALENKLNEMSIQAEKQQL